jgi:hypothetical protein
MKFTALFLSALAISWGQSRVSPGPHRIEITVEKLESGTWRIIDPGLVLAEQDRVRFRFRANFSGYLYVTNLSTSGNSSLLFPREDTGSNNRIAAGREYRVPATEGAFRVAGPAGYDVVSWTVSPVRLGRPETPPEPPAAGRMTPRCDDTLFRARGQCIDSSAGPQAKKAQEPGGLMIIREKDSSVVSSAEPLTGPVVYQFLLAHK